MPFIHIYDNSIPTQAALAGNVGTYQTGQDSLHNQLNINQDNRAQVAADQASQDSADRLQYQYDALDATNRRYQSGIDNKYALQELGADEKYTLQDLRNKAAQGLLDERSKAHLTYLDAKDKFIAGENEKRINNQQDEFWNGTMPERYGATEAANQRNQNGINAANQRQQNSLDFRRQNPPGGGPGVDMRRYSADYQQWRDRANWLFQQRQNLSHALAAARKPSYLGGDQARAEALAIQLRDLENELRSHLAEQPTIPMGGGGYPQEPTYIDNEQDMTGQSANPAAEQAPQPQSVAPPQPQTIQDYAALPPGTTYFAPDGTVRIKQSEAV